MSINQNIGQAENRLENIGTKLEMQSALEDRWRQINDMSLDEFKAASDKITDYGKYKISESFGVLGTYNSDGTCSGEEPNDETKKACRIATLTVQDKDGNPVLGPVSATRVASASGGDGLAVGCIVAVPSSDIPENYLKCDGSTFSKTKYPKLYKFLGTDVLPNYSGVFLRGYGTQSFIQNNGSLIGETETIYSSNALGAIQGDAIRNIYGTALIRVMEMGYSGALYSTFAGSWGIAAPNPRSGLQQHLDSSRVVPTANENRPINIAVQYVIKAK